MEIRSFVAGDRLGLSGLTVDLPPATATQALVDSRGFERELTRSIEEDVHSFAALNGVEFTGSGELGNGTPFQYGSPNGGPDAGVGYMVGPIEDGSKSVLSGFTPSGAAFDSLLGDLATLELAIDGEDEIVVSSFGTMSVSPFRAPSISQVVGDIGLVTIGMATPDRAGKSGGLLVAGGELFQQTSTNGTYLILDGGNVIAHLLPHPDLVDVDGALEMAASLVIEVL